MNMRMLKKSQLEPRTGDIFAFQIVERMFHFGRVIRLDTRIGRISNLNAILVYIYRRTSPTKTDIPVLSRDELLIPPTGTDRLPWLRGYFETVAHRPLAKADVLAQHCFYNIGGSSDHPYVDEYGRPIPDRVEPCGVFAIGSYGAIDYEVSEVLGLPLPTD